MRSSLFSTLALASAALVSATSANRLLSSHSRLAARDASTLMSGGTNNEGEDHTPLVVPSGASLKDIAVGTDGDQIAVYWGDEPKSSDAVQAFVMIAGKLRNGNEYWKIMNDALQSAVKDNYAGANANSIVVAPQFFSTKYNSGQYSKNELGWADVNAWQAGEVATHPDGTTQSAFDALDAIVSEFANSTKYPKLTNLTLVGHGGGGQLMQRYAVVGADTPENIHVRHIVGDPSSCAYFTTDRPLNDTSIADKSTCEMYNTWRYGFDNFTGTHAKSGAMPIDYFSTYVKRDVVNMVGYQDTSKNGDQYCMAQLQGGVARRDRNLAWWKYINTLARTNYDVSGFPGNFTDPLPDWSNVTGNTISHRLIVVENATHDAAAVFGGAEGRAALFSNGELPTGWRPAGWNPAGNGQLVKASVSSSSSATKSGSGTAAKSSRQASAAASRLGGAASFGALAAAALLFAGILIL